MTAHADDTMRIGAALRNAGLCLDCIVEGTGVPKAQARAALEQLGETVRVTLGQTVCDGCLKTKPVFRFA